MVKLQKPSPKTLNTGITKAKKSTNFKKEKLPKAKTAAPAADVPVKKQKLKLIEKALNEAPKVALKPTKNVDKNKKTPVATAVPKAEPIGKKDNKKALIKETSVVATVKLQKDAKKKPNVIEQKPLQQKEEKKGKKKNGPPAPAKGKQIENVDKKASNEPKAQEKVKPSAPGLKGKKKKKQDKSKGEKKAVDTGIHFEAVPFDEDKFNAVVNLKNIKKIGQALKTMVEKEVTEKKNSIFEDFRYLLNVCSFKIPNCPKRMVKLNLAHSLVDPKEDDVVIIVPDLQRGAKVDYEPTVQHYEDKLQGCRLKIVPFNQFRRECTTFEAKRKFASTYDHFLCDGRIVGHVVGFAGSNFQKPRTTFHAVRLGKDKTYRDEIEKALKRTAFKQLEKGDLISIPVGNHRFTVDQLAENIKLIVDQLKTVYPGGLSNIRNMHVKIDITGTSSLPLYASWTTPPAETPNVVGMREKRMIQLKKAANEVLSQFNMSKTGEFVKLNKDQAERKRKIQEARKTLLIEGLVATAEGEDGGEDEKEAVPTKKSKKIKQEISKSKGKQKALSEEDVEEKDKEEESENRVEAGSDNDNDEDDDNEDEDDDENDEDDDGDEDDDDDDDEDDDADSDDEE